MDPGSFFAELKRRNVYKIAVAYVVVAWLLIQAASILLPTFEAPLWVMKVLVLLVLLGFPIALVLAWAFELTPEGMKRTEEDVPRKTGRKLTAVIAVLAVVAAGLMVFQLVGFPTTRDWAGRSPESDGHRSAATLPIPDQSIAVLPFVDLSQAKDQEYFCDGISEQILDALAKVEGLRVVARTSAFSFKSKNVEVPEIARRLSVRHILEGSLRREGNRIRISAQLINAQDGFHIWSDTFERELQGIFAVQDEITHAIVNALKIKLAVALSAQKKPSTEAYDLYLRGRFYWNKRTADALKKSIEYFNQAIAKEPNYALAYTGVADSYGLLGFHGYAVLPPREAFPKAKAAAEKALQIDETLGEAHSSIASVKGRYDWDEAGAEKGYRRALELNPNYATAHQWYALHLALTERRAEAVAEMKKARELDPLSVVINMNLAWVLYFDRRYDEAIAQGHKTLELDPNYYATHWIVGQAYRQKGMYEEAIAEFQKSVNLSGGHPIYRAALGHAYAVAGRRDDAAKIINELKDLSTRTYFPPYFIALIYVGLGDADQALGWLKQAFTERSPGMTFLRAEPMFDPVRSDPRFQDLLRRVASGR